MVDDNESDFKVTVQSNTTDSPPSPDYAIWQSFESEKLNGWEQKHTTKGLNKDGLKAEVHIRKHEGMNLLRL